MRNKKGITLIALVITIIVLLILAGVSLNLIAGENGILGRATRAVDKTEIVTGKEEVELLISDLGVEFYEEKYVNGKSDLGEINDYILGQFTTSKDTEGGYTVSIEKSTKKVTVTKKGKPVATGELKDGKIIWDKEITSGGEITEPEEPEIKQTILADVTNANIGDYIDLKTNILDKNNITLADGSNPMTDWRIFYKKGDNVYAILADYLPNSMGCAQNAGLFTYSTYSVSEPSATTENARDSFINKLNNTEIWGELVNGISGITVTGGASYEQLKTSWNNNSKMSTQLEDTVVFQRKDDPTGLYRNRNEEDSYCSGYWLATRGQDNNDEDVLAVKGNFGLSSGHVMHTLAYGLRPVVCLPSNISVEYHKNNNLWKLK